MDIVTLETQSSFSLIQGEKEVTDRNCVTFRGEGKGGWSGWARQSSFFLKQINLEIKTLLVLNRLFADDERPMPREREKFSYRCDLLLLYIIENYIFFLPIGRKFPKYKTCNFLVMQ